MVQVKDQIWFCRVCEKRGEIRYEQGANVLKVALEITKAHYAVSPKCPGENVQAANDTTISQDELAAIMVLQHTPPR